MAMISRMSSGSRRAESAVEPTRSQNITVSWRRSAEEVGSSDRGDADAVADSAMVTGFEVESLCPHSKQNFALAGLAQPHEGQRIGRAAPHAVQNLSTPGVSAWQLGHSTAGTLLRRRA